MSHQPLRAAFRLEARPVEGSEDGVRRTHIIAHCHRCDREDALPVSKHSGAVPAEAGQRMFRKLGWRMGSSRNKDECPMCAGAAKIDSAPEKDREIMALGLVASQLRDAIVPPVVEEPDPVKPKARKAAKKPAEPRPNPDNMPTALGAALVRGALEKQDREELDRLVSAQARDLKREPPASRRKGMEAIERWRAGSTPEQRSEIARKAGKARAEKARQKAAAEQRSQRIKDHWASLTPEQKAERQRKRIETFRRNRVAQAKEQMEDLVQTSVAPAPAPDGIRTPTRDDNRRIREALDTHYDEDAQHYIGAMRDAKLAAKLDVPAAWVSDIREAFYGPDRSQHDGAQEALRAELEARIGTIRAEADGILGRIAEEVKAVETKALDEVAALMDQIKALESRLPKRL